MLKEVLRSKIHMARVTEANVEYEGSITIDKELAEKVDLERGDRVLIGDVENGNRFETYVIYGKKGEICVNGAAANLVDVGDRLIIMAFGMSEKSVKPEIIKLDEKNRII